MNGDRRLQILSFLEPFFPGNSTISKEYAPVYSLWVSERNAKTGASSQSLFWNLYRHEKTDRSRKTSILFGLFEYKNEGENSSLRLFYLPIGKSGASQTESSR